MNSNQIVPPNAMPVQQLPTYPPGATSPMNAGLKLQQQQTANQMALIGSSGGSLKRSYRAKRRHKKYSRGGAAQVQVPPVPAGTVNPQMTGNNYTQLTKLAESQSSQAVFDNARTPAQTAAIATQQKSMYSGGYTRRKRSKRRRLNKRKTKRTNRRAK